jgi:hypothetical protein
MCMVSFPCRRVMPNEYGQLDKPATMSTCPAGAIPTPLLKRDAVDRRAA